MVFFNTIQNIRINDEGKWICTYHLPTGEKKAKVFGSKFNFARSLSTAWEVTDKEATKLINEYLDNQKSKEGSTQINEILFHVRNMTTKNKYADKLKASSRKEKLLKQYYEKYINEDHSKSSDEWLTKDEESMRIRANKYYQVEIDPKKIYSYNERVVLMKENCNLMKVLSKEEIDKIDENYERKKEVYNKDDWGYFYKYYQLDSNE